MSRENRGTVVYTLLLGIVFLRPMVSGLWIDYFSSRILLDFLLRTAVFIILIALATGKTSDRLKLPLSIYPLALWLLWGMVTVLHAYLEGRSLFTGLQRVGVYVSLAALGVVTASVVPDRERRDGVVEFLVLSSIVIALYAFWQYFAGFERSAEFVREFGGFGFESDKDAAIRALRDRRVFSLTFSPDMLAGMMAVMSLLGVGLALKSWRVSDRRGLALGIVSTALCIPAIYVSGSLGGWLALLGGLMVYIVSVLRDNRRFFRVAVLFVLLLSIAAGGIVLRRYKTFTDLDHPNNPVAQRLNYWIGGARVLAETPVFGAGPGHYGPAYLGVKSESAGKTRFAHNFAVQYFSEMGAPGGIAFVWIAAIFLLNSFRKSGDDELGAGIFAAGCSFLAHAFIDYDTEVIEVAALLWILIGLSAREGPESGQRSRAGDLVLRVSVVAISAIGIFFGMVNIIGGYHMQMAEYALDAGDMESAKAQVEEARRFRPLDPARAMLAVDIGKRSSAGVTEMEDSFKDLMDLESMDSGIWMEIGSFYLSAGDWKRAAYAFEKANELDPTFDAARGMLHFSRARLYARNGKLEKAESELRKVLDDFPNHQGALEGLKYIERMKNKTPESPGE